MAIAPPQKPTRTMPPFRALLLCLVALIFDALQFACNVLTILAPIALGAGAAYYADQSSLLSWLPSSVVGTFTAGAGAALLVASGGIAVVEMAGVIVSIVVGIFGWLLLGLWLILSGVPILFHPSRATALFWGVVTSLTPFINGGPTFISAIGRVVYLAWREDKKDLKNWKEKLVKLETERKNKVMSINAARVARVRGALEAQEFATAA